MGSRQKSPSSRGFQGTLLSWFPLLPAARPASSLSRRPHWHWVRTRPSPPAHSEGVTPPAPGPRCPPAPPGKACPPLRWTVSRPERLFSALSPASLANPSSHSHTANLTRLAALSAWRPFPNQCLPVNSSVATGSRGQERRTLLIPRLQSTVVPLPGVSHFLPIPTATQRKLSHGTRPLGPLLWTHQQLPMPSGENAKP